MLYHMSSYKCGVLQFSVISEIGTICGVSFLRMSRFNSNFIAEVFGSKPFSTLSSAGFYEFWSTVETDESNSYAAIVSQESTLNSAAEVVTVF